MQQRWAAAGRSFAAVKGAYFPQSTNTGLRPNREWVSPGRYRRRILAAPGIGGEIRQLEELSPSVRPTQCRGDRPCRARWVIQLVIAAIGIRLQDAGEAVKVPRGMLVPAVARGVIESCQRRATAKGSVVPHKWDGRSSLRPAKNILSDPGANAVCGVRLLTARAVADLQPDVTRLPERSEDKRLVSAKP